MPVAGSVEDGPDATRELLVATLGCNVAWGVIDGAMFLMGALLERSRRVRTLVAVQRAPDEATALAEIDRVLDGTVLDFDEHNLLATSFTLKNPHAKSTCGCGESFSA